MEIKVNKIYKIWGIYEGYNIIKILKYQKRKGIYMVQLLDSSDDEQSLVCINQYGIPDSWEMICELKGYGTPLYKVLNK